MLLQRFVAVLFRRVSVVLAVSLMASGLAVLPPAFTSPAAADPGSQSFVFNGAAQSWTVPAGVTSIRVDVRGAQGGLAYGGPGGRTRATLQVTPGQRLQVNIGGAGAFAAGGFNGGGGTLFNDWAGGGGGGASDIRVGSCAATLSCGPAARVVVAGGGGGAASSTNPIYGPGGAGGSDVGESGAAGTSYTGGGGGTQNAGGSAGNDGWAGGGSSGDGGRGGSWGSGGGGGYYGGGGGATGAGGGGGSSYAGSGTSAVVMDRGVQRGNGQVTFTWPAGPDPAPVPSSGSVSFAYDPQKTPQFWQVPDGVTAVSIDVQGAQGGWDQGGVNHGGLGGHVQATVPVRPGQQLAVLVGGAGQFASAGGFNGGGGTLFQDWAGGGGGGASDVRVGSATLGARAVVGGGGGGAASSGTPIFGTGGDGGGLVGQAGANGSPYCCLYGNFSWEGGGGGGQSAGGPGGGRTDEPGSHWSGGGGLGVGGQAAAWAGGGGGGYYGGGGGAGDSYGGSQGGGGGGSSWTTPAASSVTHVQGDRQGDGQVTIAWPPQVIGGIVSAASLRASGSPSQGCVCPRELGDPVEVSTGNFSETFTDLAVPGRGVPLGFTRTYNSVPAPDAPADGRLGYGWTDNYSMSLSIAGDLSSVTVNEEGGSQVSFTLAGGVYTAPPRVQATLVHNGDGTWTFTRRARQIFVFDAAGRLTALKDLNGYTTSLAYNGSGQLTTVTDPAGRTLTMGWTAGRISSVTDTATPPRTVTYAYDGAGNLSDVIDVAGGHWQFGYDANHRLTTMRTPKYYGDTTTVPTPVTTNHYDSSGRVDWQTDPLGRQTSFDYTSIANSTKVTDPKGNITVDTYDANRLLIAETRGYGTAQAATWTFTHDPATLGVIAVVDPNGAMWTTGYDPAGNITGRSDPLGRTTAATYNALSEPLTMTDAAGVTTTSTYDPAGNLLSMSTPLVGSNPPVAKAVSFAYGDPAHPGDVTAVTDPAGKVWPQTWDSAGNLATVTDPLGNKTQACYDNVGRKTKTISPKGWAAGVTCATVNPTYTTTISPNAYGDPLLVTDPLGHQTVYTYDANRNPSTVRDPNLHTTTSTYDPANQLTTVTRADTPATTLRHDYHPDRKLWHTYDGANQPTTYGYDPLGRVTSVTDPLNRTTTYGYDSAGHQTSKQDPGGNCAASPATGCTTMAYDAAGQLSAVTYSDGLTPNVSGVVYDPNGRRRSMTDGTGTSSWVYDSLGRLTSETNGAGQTIGYSYDLRGDVTTIAYPGSTGTVTRVFDDAGRLWKIKDWLNNETVFSYDADSFLTGQTYPNGTTAGYTPDAADRLMGVSHAPTVAPNSPFASFTYGRDNADLLTSVTSTGVPADTHTYGYTALNQLSTVDGATAWGYDPADNLTRRADGTTQVFDVANELASTLGNSISVAGAGGAANSNSTTLTVTFPATQANDQILLAVTLPYGKNLTSSLTGWTPVGAGTFTAGTTTKTQVYRRTAGAGETSVALTFDAKYAKSANVVVYRGVNPANPVDVVQSSATPSGASLAVPSVTPTLPNERLVFIQGAVSNQNGNWNTPAGMTRQGNQQPTTAAKTVQAIADQALTTTAPTPAGNVGYTASGGLVGVAITLRPTSTTYGYDSRGNRTSVAPAGGPTTTNTYDQANRLTTVSTPGSADSTYAYNGDGLRTRKTAAGTTTTFTWASADGLPLLLVDGTTNYIYGPGGLPLEQITSSGTVTYYHHDQLGSTRALTNSSGAVVATYTYDPYGKLTGSTGSATNPFGYAGQYTDAETGLVYMRARYYDPATGQFLTRDPLEEQTREAYGYVGGNPLNATDPLGLCWGPGCWVRDHWRGTLQVVAGTAAVVGVGACIVLTEGACAVVAGGIIARGAAGVVTAGAVAMTVSAGHDMYDLIQNPEHYERPETGASCPIPSGGPAITSGSPPESAPSFWDQLRDAALGLGSLTNTVPPSGAPQPVQPGAGQLYPILSPVPF